MSEVRNKDAATLRREARRRNILENSGNRLQKITDLPTASGSTNSAYHRNHLSGADRNFDLPVAQKAPDELSNLTNLFTKIRDAPETSTLPREVIFPEPVPKISSKDNLVRKLLHSDQCHVFMLSMFTFILLSLDMGSYIFHNILYPFFTLQLVKLPLYWYSKNSKATPTIKLVLSMLQVRNKSILPTLEIFFWFTNLTKELCLYLFVFVFINEIVSALSNV